MRWFLNLPVTFNIYENVNKNNGNNWLSSDNVKRVQITKNLTESTTQQNTQRLQKSRATQSVVNSWRKLKERLPWCQVIYIWTRNVIKKKVKRRIGNIENSERKYGAQVSQFHSPIQQQYGVCEENAHCTCAGCFPFEWLNWMQLCMPLDGICCICFVTFCHNSYWIRRRAWWQEISFKPNHMDQK